jgi:hypothetical protein
MHSQKYSVVCDIIVYHQGTKNTALHSKILIYIYIYIIYIYIYLSASNQFTIDIAAIVSEQPSVHTHTRIRVYTRVYSVHVYTHMYHICSTLIDV